MKLLAKAKSGVAWKVVLGVALMGAFWPSWEQALHPPGRRSLWDSADP